MRCSATAHTCRFLVLFREDLKKYATARIPEDLVGIAGLHAVLGESKALMSPDPRKPRNNEHGNRLLVDGNGVPSFASIHKHLYPYAQVRFLSCCPPCFRTCHYTVPLSFCSTCSPEKLSGDVQALTSATSYLDDASSVPLRGKKPDKPTLAVSALRNSSTAAARQQQSASPPTDRTLSPGQHVILESHVHIERTPASQTRDVTQLASAFTREPSWPWLTPLPSKRYAQVIEPDSDPPSSQRTLAESSSPPQWPKSPSVPSVSTSSVPGPFADARFRHSPSLVNVFVPADQPSPRLPMPPPAMSTFSQPAPPVQGPFPTQISRGDSPPPMSPYAHPSVPQPPPSPTPEPHAHGTYHQQAQYPPTTYPAILPPSTSPVPHTPHTPATPGGHHHPHQQSMCPTTPQPPQSPSPHPQPHPQPSGARPPPLRLGNLQQQQQATSQPPPIAPHHHHQQNPIQPHPTPNPSSTAAEERTAQHLGGYYSGAQEDSQLMNPTRPMLPANRSKTAYHPAADPRIPEPSAPPAPSKPLTVRSRFAKLAKKAFSGQALRKQFTSQRTQHAISNSNLNVKRGASSPADLSSSKDAVCPSSGETSTGDRIGANRIGANPALEVSVRAWGSNAVASGATGGASAPAAPNAPTRTATLRARMQSMMKGAIPKNLTPKSMV